MLGAARGAHAAVTLYGIIAATGPAIRPDVQEVIMVSWTVVLVSLFLFHGSCQARGTHDPEKFLEEAGQIYTTIFHKYNKRVRPPDDYPSKVKVNVQAVLIHIRQLDLLKQELESVLALNITWDDKRLAWYAYQVYNITEGVDQVWSPSIIYLNSAVPPNPLFFSKVTISSEGLITWYRQEVVTTVCRTNPKEATQTCAISLGFTSPHADEEFGNVTTFELSEEFSNHAWEVQPGETEVDNSRKINFVLFLEQLEPMADRPEDKNQTDAMDVVSNGNASKASSVLVVMATNCLVVTVFLCNCMLLYFNLY